MTDRELLQRYKDGDGNAFTDFFNRHVKDVTRWVKHCYNLPLSEIDAAVQSAFLSISRNEIPDNPRVYLEQAALQQAKVIKFRKKKRNDMFGSIHEVTHDNKSATGDCKSDNFIAPELVEEHHLDKFRRLVDQAIGTLPPKEREVMCELRKDNHTGRVGKKLGIDSDTVRWHRDRAIKKLKPILA